MRFRKHLFPFYTGALNPKKRLQATTAIPGQGECVHCHEACRKLHLFCSCEKLCQQHLSEPEKLPREFRPQFLAQSRKTTSRQLFLQKLGNRGTGLLAIRRRMETWPRICACRFQANWITESHLAEESFNDCSLEGSIFESDSKGAMHNFSNVATRSPSVKGS